MSNARIYVVTDKTTDTRLLVKAISQAQAIRHAASDRLECSVPSGLEVAEMMAAGAKLADATVPQADLFDAPALEE